jgi:uncharacterized Zn finger protein (UPF0148 family)
MIMAIVRGKKTHINDVIAFAIQKGGKFLSTEYTNMLEKYLWECDKGHVFTATFNHVKNRGQWCPICGREKAIKSLIQTMKNQDVREKIRKAHWHRNGISSYEELFNKRAKNKKNRFLHRLRTDPQERLKHNIRVRTRMAIKNKISVTESLGCTWDELCAYLESKFQPGMSWDNYGEWHVDHIKPLSSFNLEDPAEFKKACHYTNLQPLWAKDNLVKSNKT